jgi:plasmid stabilization system protein ParE
MTPAFHPLADAELTDAATFYEAAAPGLGEDFLQEIERLLALIDVYPEVGHEHAFGIRTLAARRFPYALVYLLAAEGPLVLAVAHNRRQPRYWANRID